jgi:hypothetical protein
MANSKFNNDSIVTNNTKRIGGMKKYVTNSKTEIPVGGEVLKPADVIAIFQDSLDTRAAVTAAHAQYKSALADRATAEAKRSVADEALKGYVLQRFGANSAEAHEFGYSARKVPVLSAEARATAVAANKATREARGTMGRRAKLKIKGAPVAPTAPAAPAITPPAHAVVPVSAATAPVPAPTAPAAVANGAAAAATPAVNAPAAGNA